MHARTNMRRVALGVLLSLGLGMASAALCGCLDVVPSAANAITEATVSAEVAALLEAWAEGQKAQDAQALASLYTEDYAYNGQTAAEVAQSFLLPRDEHTKISTLTLQFIEPLAEQQAEGEVWARVSFSGSIAAQHLAEYLPGAAAQGLDPSQAPPRAAARHEHEHEHEHGEQPSGGAALTGSVPVRGFFDMRWTVADTSSGPRLSSQTIVRGQMLAGPELAVPLLANVALESAAVRCGEEFHVTGSVALLGSGRVLAQVGSGAPVSAEVSGASFHAHLVAPSTPGEYVVLVRAGNVVADGPAAAICWRGLSLRVAEHSE